MYVCMCVLYNATESARYSFDLRVKGGDGCWGASTRSLPFFFHFLRSVILTLFAFRVDQAFLDFLDLTEVEFAAAEVVEAEESAAASLATAFLESFFK